MEKSKVQSVLIPKKNFTLKKSHKWLLKHNFKIPKKVDETINFYRYRQKLPNKKNTYTTKVLPNGVELVLMQKTESVKKMKEIDPELNISKKEYENLFQAYNYFKSYQLKDLIRQYVEEYGNNISYKTANKKRLLDLVIRYNINPSNYIIVEKNPVMRVPTNVLKKFG